MFGCGLLSGKFDVLGNNCSLHLGPEVADTVKVFLYGRHLRAFEVLQHE